MLNFELCVWIGNLPKEEMTVYREQEMAISYLAIQMVHTSLGPCLRGHSTWAGLNGPSLEDFAFSLEVRLNLDVAFLAGTLNPLAWCVNCQLAVFTERGFRTPSSATLHADWSLLSFWGDRRELRRLGWDVLLGDCWLLPLFCFFISSLGESVDKWYKILLLDLHVDKHVKYIQGCML